MLHSGQARQNNLDKFSLEILRLREVKEDGSLFVRPFVVDHNGLGCFFVGRPFVINLKRGLVVSSCLVRTVVLVDFTVFVAFVVLFVATLDRPFGVIGLFVLQVKKEIGPFVESRHAADGESFIGDFFSSDG